VTFVRIKFVLFLVTFVLQILSIFIQRKFVLLGLVLTKLILVTFVLTKFTLVIFVLVIFTCSQFSFKE
jgi:hypothetical protein